MPIAPPVLYSSAQFEEQFKETEWRTAEVPFPDADFRPRGAYVMDGIVGGSWLGKMRKRQGHRSQQAWTVVAEVVLDKLSKPSAPE